MVLTKVNKVGRQDAAKAGCCGADPHTHVSDHSGVQLSCVHVDHGIGRGDSKLAHHHQGSRQIKQFWRERKDSKGKRDQCKGCPGGVLFPFSLK